MIEIAVLVGCVLLLLGVLSVGAYVWGYFIDSGKWKDALRYVKKNVHPW